MTQEDLKTGMLLLMQNDVLRLIVGNTAISYNDGGIPLKDLKFSGKDYQSIKAIYAEPKRKKRFRADFKFWLKDKYFLDEKYKPKLLWECEEFEYPMWFARGKTYGSIVKFTSLRGGEFVVGDNDYPKGYKFENWVPHTNTDIWEQVEDPTILKHKDALWCWNDDFTFGRWLVFWNANNKCPFNINEESYSLDWDNYEKIQPEDEPYWCEEKRKQLK